MGKTADGAVWLNSDLLSPFDYWQFWRNTADADVGRFMRLFTDLSLEQIAEYEALEGAAINEAKKALADAATTDSATTSSAHTTRRFAPFTMPWRFPPPCRENRVLTVHVLLLRQMWSPSLPRPRCSRHR